MKAGEIKDSKHVKYESYPAWTALIYYFFNFSVYFAGLYLLYLIHPVLMLPLFAIILYLEISVLRNGCTRCYYYGKICVCAKGKVAGLFFRKSERKFNEQKVTAKGMIPSFLPTIITLIAGAYLIVTGLPSINLFIILLTAWPLIETFLGNPIIYGKMACPHCKQMDLGCPACEFFTKGQKKNNVK